MFEAKKKTPDNINIHNSRIVDKLWCVSRMEFDSNIQKNQLDLYLLTWRNNHEALSEQRDLPNNTTRTVDFH